MGEKRIVSSILFIAVILSLGLALTNYVDPTGYPAFWPDNPSPALASFEFSTTADLLDYYPTGAWSVSGGLLSITSNGQSRAILNGSEAWTDYSLKVLARVVGAEDSSYKVFARTTGGASGFDGYAFEIDTNYSNRFAIKRIVNGIESATLITSVTSTGFDWNQWQEISVTVIGNEFSMHINGIEVLRYTDTEDPYLSGNVGLGCDGTIQLEFDYVRVYNASVDLREWIPYTYSGDQVYDESGSADGSSGGSVNPSQVDIVSTPSLPSVMVYFDSGVMMFRIVLGGNPLSLSGRGTPYTSSTWVILIDVDGDGYRDFAVELDGTDSGNAPDDIRIFYGEINDQYLYDGDMLWKQDSARHRYNPTDSDGEPEKPANWDVDPSPSVWDFSRTRVTEYSDPIAGTVYILDIQVPLSALDATAVGGPKLTTSSVFQLAFTTSANTNNPVQKDLAYQGIFNMDTNSPVLFGDPINTSGQISQIPLTSKITVTGCGPSLVEALVQDASILVDGQISSSVTGVEFFYYFDFNENGLADDGFDWISIGNATSVDGFNPWRFSWDTSQIPRGNYIVKSVVVDYQGNTMDSYFQYTDGDLRQVALFENTCSSLNLSISGIVFEDVGNDGYSYVPGTDLPKEGVRVRLYRELDENETLSNGDSFVAETVTDNSGTYSFGALPPYRYYIVVNSRDIVPAGINAGFSAEAAWAEQTFKRQFVGSSYQDLQAFGGVNALDSDFFSFTSTAAGDNNYQHQSVADITEATEPINGIDHGFSFNVVVNSADSGINAPGSAGNQGTFRQFVLNSNVIEGPNAVKFVLMTPQNSTSGSNSWWTIKAASAFPGISDAGTSISGIVFSDSNSVEKSNLSSIAGGVAGTSRVSVPEIAGAEIEIDCNNVTNCLMTEGTASDFSLSSIAFFNAGGSLGDQSAALTIEGPNANLTGLILGSRADGTKPSDDLLNRRFGLIFGSSGDLSNSYIAHNGSGLLIKGSSVNAHEILVYGNGIGSAGTDGNGITIVSPASQIKISNSIVDLNGGNHAGVTHGNGVYTFGDFDVTLENLTVSSSTASGISLNLSENMTVRHTAIHDSLSGPGIRVSNDSVTGNFTQNTFYGNRGLSIDLLRNDSTSMIEGVNENSGNLNPDYGNSGVDHPVVTTAYYSDSSLLIEGYVGDSVGSAVFSGAIVEIYSALVGEGDAYMTDSYGEGLKYLGSTLVDSSGSFSETIETISQEITVTGITILNDSSSEFGPNKQIGAGLAINGYVFKDSNQNRAMDPGEQGIPDVRIELWKYETGNWSMQEYTETDSGGFYSFSASQGSYRVVEDAQNLYDSSTEGSDPAGYISTTPNWVELIVENSDRSANFGDFKGFIVKGFVFDDSGAGLLENANNAVKDLGEKGIAGAKVVLRNGPDIYTRFTDQDGIYRFYVSGDPAYPIAITEYDPGQYTSTGDYDSDGSDPLEERNRILIASGINSETLYSFADVRRLLLSNINSASGKPNSVVFFDHFLDVFTPGAVHFEAVSARGFDTKIHETNSAGGIIEEWDQTKIRVPGLYYIKVAVSVPLDAPNGTMDSIIVRALQNWANSNGTDSAMTSDTLTVGMDGLVISKETRNFTRSSVWSLVSEGRPGEVIEYRISFSNSGVSPINSLIVTDPLDRNLDLLQESYTVGELQGNVFLCVGDNVYLLIAEESGDTNHDHAFVNENVLTIEVTRIAGAIQPGSSGCLLFKVKIVE